MPAIYNALFTDADIKVRYREPYLTDGLNAKMAVTAPRGFYRGFKLKASATNFTVDIAADSATSDHVAIYEVGAGSTSTSRYSLTLRKSGGNFSLNLTALNGVSPVTVYVVLYATYTLGVATAAEIRAYTVAEFAVLSSTLQSELLVLGTCVIPASGSPAPVTVFDGGLRTVPWAEQATDAVPWSPLLRNPGFDHGATSTGVRYGISDWDNRFDLAVNGGFRLGTATPRTGFKHLVFNKNSTATSTARIEQLLEVPVIPTQQLRLVGWVRQLIAPTAGTFKFLLYWGDEDSTTVTSTAYDFTTLSATDAAYRKIDTVFVVPSGKYVLKSVSIEATGVTAATSGFTLAVDDVQIYLQTGAGFATPGAQNRRLSQDISHALLLEDASTYSLGQIAALVRYNKATPSGEGRVILERRDQDGSSPPPALQIKGRLIELGSDMQASGDYGKARIHGNIANNIFYSLLQEFENEASGSMLRIYSNTLGHLFVTVNASWNNTNWDRDNTVVRSTRMFMGADDGSALTISQAEVSAGDPFNDNEWSDFAKLQGSEPTTAINPVFEPMLLMKDSAGNKRVIVDHNGMVGARVSVLRQEWVAQTLALPWTAFVSGTGTVAYVYETTQLFSMAARFRTTNAAGSSEVKVVPLHVVRADDQIHTMEWEAYWASTGASPGISIEMGIFNDAVASFVKEDGNANWKCRSNEYGGTSPVLVSSGVAAGGSAQRFRIELYGNSTAGGGRVLFYINGALVHESNTVGADLPLNNEQMAVDFKLLRTSAVITHDLYVGPVQLRTIRLVTDDAL